MKRGLENHLSDQNNAFTNRLGDGSERNKVWKIDCQLIKKKKYIRYLIILFTPSQKGKKKWRSRCERESNPSKPI